MMYVETNKFNTYGNNQLICPYCGHENDTDDIYSDEFDRTCSSCDKEFSVQTNTQITYTTNCLESEHEVVSDGEYKKIGNDDERYFRCKSCEYTGWCSDEEAKRFKSVEIIPKDDIPY